MNHVQPGAMLHFFMHHPGDHRVGFVILDQQNMAPFAFVLHVPTPPAILAAMLVAPLPVLALFLRIQSIVVPVYVMSLARPLLIVDALVGVPVMIVAAVGIVDADLRLAAAAQKAGEQSNGDPGKPWHRLPPQNLPQSAGQNEM